MGAGWTGQPGEPPAEADEQRGADMDGGALAAEREAAQRAEKGQADLADDHRRPQQTRLSRSIAAADDGHDLWNATAFGTVEIAVCEPDCECAQCWRKQQGDPRPVGACREKQLVADVDQPGI